MNGDLQEQLLRATLQMAVPLEIEKLRGTDPHTLQMAVPLEIEKLRGTDPHTLLDAARAEDLTTADAMMFGGQGASAALAAHVRVFAALALTAWGGITIAGMHWCPRPGCPGRDEADHPHPLLSRPDHPTLWHATTQPRPVTTVPLPETEAA